MSKFLLAYNLRGLTVGWLVGWLVVGGLNRHHEIRKLFETSNGRLPPNKAQIGVKLWQNAFRTICNLSFFDT